MYLRSGRSLRGAPVHRTRNYSLNRLLHRRLGLHKGVIVDQLLKEIAVVLFSLVLTAACLKLAGRHMKKHFKK